jgi:hypothetical protein
MVNNKFQNELDKLEQLLNKLNKKNNNKQNKRNQKGGQATDAGVMDQLASTEAPQQEEQKMMTGGKKNNKRKTVRKSVKKGKKSQRGGAMMDERPARHFVVVMVNGKEIKEEDAPKIKLYLITKNGKLNKQGPRDAASKAFSKLCRKYGKKEECTFSFSIRETTRASEFEHKGKKYTLRGENKHHNYQGKRVKLSKAEQEATKRKLKNGKFIINKYRNELKSKGMEKANHQKGGWTFYS